MLNWRKNLGKFNFFRDDAITNAKPGTNQQYHVGESYIKKNTKTYNDAVDSGKFIQLGEDNPMLTLAYEGHGLKKFTGKFEFTPTIKGIVKKDHDIGAKL